GTRRRPAWPTAEAALGCPSGTRRCRRPPRRPARCRASRAATRTGCPRWRRIAKAGDRAAPPRTSLPSARSRSRLPHWPRGCRGRRRTGPAPAPAPTSRSDACQGPAGPRYREGARSLRVLRPRLAATGLRNFEELVLLADRARQRRRLRIGFDDIGHDHHDQLGLVLALVLRLEQVAQQR